MTNVVIAGYARSPFTPAKKGALARVRPDDLAAQVVRRLVAEAAIPSKEIEDLIVGCAFPEGEQGFNVARLIGLMADLDLSVGGVTVNRFCGSSMQSVHMAAGQIALGAGEAFVCAGVESMSRVPMMGFNPMPNPALHEKRPGAYIGMGDTAENVARRWEISREDQEAFAVASHRKAAAAQAEGRLAAEIVPIATKGGTVETDGCIRADASAEGLAGLKPAFQQDGSVTAGTSSPLTDGASAVLVCSEAFASRHGLKPLARVAAVAVSGCEPEIMGIGPVAASRKAMARAGITADALSVVELNEAFASQSIACIRDLGLDEDREHRRRRHRARPSAGRHGRAHRRQGGLAARPRGRPLRAGHPMHRRRPGHRHPSGARVMTGIRKVAVIGAGVMGSGIAAHVANAGVPVLLMDIVPEGAADRNALAKGAIARMLKTEPAAFMSPRAAKLVEACNIEDHLDRLADVDWIVEVVIERLDAKQALYRRIDAVRRPGTAVSSNTSTIPLAALIEGMPDAFAKDFLITHFFNPPRYMRLLEVVTGPKTDPALAATVTDFADRKLGKSVVACKDRPGFIANRLGIFWIQNAIAAADDLGVPVEEADAIMGRPFGIPKTGVFGLVDLVGLDLIPHTTKSLRAALPAEDAFHATYREMPLITKLIAEGYTGRKGKGGFYRLNRTDGQKTKEAVDLKTGAYRPSAKADLPELKEAKGPRAVLDLPAASAPTPGR